MQQPGIRYRFGGDWIRAAGEGDRFAKTASFCEDTDDGFYASPVLAEGRIYLLSRSGVMHVFKASEEYEDIAMPDLGEEANSTAAFIGDSLYLRGMEYLYRIGP